MSVQGKDLLLSLPHEWTNDERGDYFEAFVADLLRPLRYRVQRRLRFTGMEIDLLAQAIDQPRTVLVECKAQRDPLPADTISKLLGNVDIRGADAGWLFSTSDLTKDGRGQWHEIQANPSLARKFTWYPPDRLIEILVDQRSVVEPTSLVSSLGGVRCGGVTLVCRPDGRFWLYQLLDQGVPAAYSVLDAQSGAPVDQATAVSVGGASERFGSLRYVAPSGEVSGATAQAGTPAPVARVVPGDAWADLRPARPTDFVGRDDVIDQALALVAQVRDGTTATRTFAVQGPSGWGKSSLVLKLSDLANKGRRVPRCSVTAVDTRSATNASFISSALRLAFLDAVKADVLRAVGDFEIGSLTHPLDSPDVQNGIVDLAARAGVIVLVFDQFEELFTKESLFETFNAIRELSLDLDSKQVPVVLGFAWKTDISLPQEHPAYHLWHELAGRRKDLVVRQFGSGDIARVIKKAEGELGGPRLQHALRARLVEQCQGYPWLLKKLLVHVSQRLRTAVSQYALLERELDVEVLFKEDLAGLKSEQLRCLGHVAQRAPAYVGEVEEQFTPQVTNSLLSKGLLVRSGLNYVIYWDIFRDYLTEGRVPQIPWARTFQRDPRSAVRGAQAVQRMGRVSVRQVANRLGGTERSWVNVMSDLVAFQIVDRVAEDQYELAPHIKSTGAIDLADHIHKQMARHVVCRELLRHDRATPVSVGDLEAIVKEMRRATNLSEAAVHQYAMNLRRWLLFSGHLEERGSQLYRATRGAQMGEISKGRRRGSKFLGAGTPDSLMALLKRLRGNRGGIREASLHKDGLRNALYDAIALGLVSRDPEKLVRLTAPRLSVRAHLRQAKATIREQPSVMAVADAVQANPQLKLDELGAALKEALGETWKPASARRYAVGVKRYYAWACCA